MHYIYSSCCQDWIPWRINPSILATWYAAEPVPKTKPSGKQLLLNLWSFGVSQLTYVIGIVGANELSNTKNPKRRDISLIAISAKYCDYCSKALWFKFLWSNPLYRGSTIGKYNLHAKCAFMLALDSAWSWLAKTFFLWGDQNFREDPFTFWRLTTQILTDDIPQDVKHWVPGISILLC